MAAENQNINTEQIVWKNPPADDYSAPSSRTAADGKFTVEKDELNFVRMKKHIPHAVLTAIFTVIVLAIIAVVAFYISYMGYLNSIRDALGQFL